MDCDLAKRHAVEMARDYDNVRKALAMNIRVRRTVKGLSQENLALSAGLDRTYISQIERSVSNPSLQSLHKIADALGIDVLDLLQQPNF